MTTFQPITKQDIREMNSSFSSICTEEKSKSTSPTSCTRKIFRAKRRGNTLNHNNQQNITNHMNHMQNIKDPDESFKTMNAEQFMQYQQDSMTKRMERKRKFDVFSSGSNSSLHSMLQSSNTFRVPYHSMFYVRVNVEINNDTKYTPNHPQNHNDTNQPPQEQEEKHNDNISRSKNAFDLMTKSSKAMSNQNWKYAESQLNLDENEHTKDMDDDDDDDDGDEMMTDNNNETKVFYPIHEECLITRSVRVCSEWVEAYNQYEIANNIAWRKFNVDGKVHEYQINRSGGVMLINLDESQQQIGDKKMFLKENEGDIKQWVLDHGYSGFIVNGNFYFYQPHLYWNLLDDNKRSKVKQTLISDMFQSTKTKPNNAPWKCTFSM